MDRGVFARQVLNAGELDNGRFDHGFVDIIDNTGTNGIDNSRERIMKVSNSQVHHNDTDQHLRVLVVGKSFWDNANHISSLDGITDVSNKQITFFCFWSSLVSTYHLRGQDAWTVEATEMLSGLNIAWETLKRLDLMVMTCDNQPLLGACQGQDDHSEPL